MQQRALSSLGFLTPGASLAAGTLALALAGTPVSIQSQRRVEAVSEPPAIPLIAQGSQWRYHLGHVAPEGEWTSAEYDDDGWLTGAAPLGWGHPSIATAAPSGSPGPPTSYFRQTFALVETSEVESVILTTRADDGIAVYVNGSEVVRDNLPGGILGYGTDATSSPGTEEALNSTVAVTIDGDKLVAGTNVVAVEVHTSSQGASDTSFDLSLVAPGGAPDPSADPTRDEDGYREGWGRPDFQDEFNRGTAKWNVRDDDSLSYDTAHILAGNVTVEDGLLNITAKRETVAGRSITTGYLDTIGKFEQQYGRWEIRAKIPTEKGVSRGIWPAFWLRNDSVGEIDIMEAWGDPYTNPTRVGTSSLTVHESTHGDGRRQSWNWETLAGVTEHSAEDFHTWALEYTPEEMRGYFDDRLVVTAAKAEYPWLWGPNFQTPMNMRLNLQVGSPYHGNPVGPDYADTRLPATFKIDYVRAWTYEG